MAAALAAVTFTMAAPVAAQAATPSRSSTVQPRSAQAKLATITWSLQKAGNPTPDQQEAYGRITSAMNAAVARYNNLSDLGKNITVQYDPGVPTADGNINGTIRFGNRAYMTERTALHEIAHTIGVGTSSRWASLTSGGTWRGAEATRLVRQYDGAGAKLSAGGGHFWPY